MPNSFSRAEILAELAKRGVNPASIGVDQNAPGAAYLSQGGGMKLSAQTEGELADYRKGAQNALKTRSDAMRFQDLNKENSTGGFMGMIPLRDKFDTGFSEMKGITEQLTPAMRQPGTGAMSDADIAMYRASTLGVDKPRGTNDAMARVIRTAAIRQADHSAFMEEWAKRNGGLTGAQEAWNAYANANPLFRQDGGNTQVNGWTPWRKWFGVDMKPASGARQQAAPQQARPKASGPQPGMVEDGYRFKGGDPSNPQSWERVQ